MQACRAGWIKKIKRDPMTWNRCPDLLKKDFQQDLEVIHELKKGWVNLLKRDPQEWDSCPTFLQMDNEVIEARKTGWVILLKHNPSEWNFCPSDLQKDPELIRMRQTSGIEFLMKQEKLALEEIPPDLFTAYLVYKNPLPPYLSSCFVAMVDEPHATLSVVKGLWRHSPKSERANAAKALAELRNYPWNFCVLAAEQQSHPLIQEMAAEGWVSRIKENAVFAKHVPELLLTHPKLKSFIAAKEQLKEAELLEQILAQVKRAPGISDERLDKLGPPEGDKKLAVQIRKLRLKYWEKAINKDWQEWERMPHSLKHDEGILTTMRETLGPQIRKNSGLWNELPDCYRQDPALQRVYNFATQKALGPNQ